MKTPLIRALVACLLAGLLLLSVAWAAEADLEITKLKVYVDDDRVKDVDASGGELDIHPGDIIDLKLKLENLNTEEDIEDIFIMATLAEIDDGDDLEANIEEFNLDPEEEEDVLLSMQIPDIIEDGTYTLTIEFEAEDEEGEEIEIESIGITVNAELERHRLKITDAHFNDKIIECGDANSLQVQVKNIGEKDIDDVRIFIENEEMKLYKLGDEFSLESGDDDENTHEEVFEFETTKNLYSGDYQIKIIPRHRHYDEDSEMHIATMRVNCEHPQEPVKKAPEKKQVKVVVLDDAATGHAVKHLPDDVIEDFDRFIDDYQMVFVIASVVMFLLLITIFFMVANKR